MTASRGAARRRCAIARAVVVQLHRRYLRRGLSRLRRSPHQRRPCSAWKRRAASSTSGEASTACCRAIGSPTSAPYRARTAAFAPSPQTGSCACRQPSRTTRLQRCCSKASPPTFSSAISPCGRGTACSSTLPPAASASSSARGREALGLVRGTVSSDAKSAARRDYGCEHVIVTRCYRFADAVPARLGRRRRRHRRPRRRSARRETSPRWRGAATGSASAGDGPLAPVPADALVAKSLSFSRPAVFDYAATRAEREERAVALWAALADGTIGCRRSSAIRSRAQPPRMRGSSRAPPSAP